MQIANRSLRCLATFIAACSIASSPAFYSSVAAGTTMDHDEFVGPFASWTNIKTAYGAVGDGITDDTAAFQRALDDVATPGHTPTLYIPAGTYKITSNLRYFGREFTNVIGEHPDTTRLKWAGGGTGVLLSIDGVSYTRFDRLTFDGAGTQVVLIDHSGVTAGGYFDTGNQFADDHFKNADIGIRCGYNANGCAEMSVLRSHFTNLRLAGIYTANFNALDIWVRYCIFDHVGTGVGNHVSDPATGSTILQGAGNFRVYNSIFRHSKWADIAIGNTGGFSFRNNYSIGSRRFIDSGGTDNPAMIIIQGNTILDTADGASISIGNQGPVVMYDNAIRSARRGRWGLVSIGAFSDSDGLALGNTFTSADPFGVNGRRTELDSSIVATFSITTPEPTLPGTEPNLNRNVTELAPGATTAAIQRAIDNAVARWNGQRPVIHFPAGSYGITSTITIPANSDVQLVGDGCRTHLYWRGGGTGPVVWIKGPSHPTLREMHIDGNGMADSIVADNIDQVGSRVFTHRTTLGLSAASQNAILVEGLDHTFIELQDTTRAGHGPSGLKLIGGPLAAAGTPQTGRVVWHSGSGYGDRMPITVSNGGSLVLRDYWYEGSRPGPYLNVSGRARVTVEGNHVSADGSPTAPTWQISNLDGQVGLIGNDSGGRISLEGNGSQAQVLALGHVRVDPPNGSYFFNLASPAAYAMLLHSRQWAKTAPGIATIQTPDQGSGLTGGAGAAPPDYIRTMLAQTRAERQRPLTSIADGVTDIRLYGVWATGGRNSIHLTAAQSSSRPPPARPSGTAGNSRVPPSDRTPPAHSR
jgi:Pectate lyase superfamily protein